MILNLMIGVIGEHTYILIKGVLVFELDFTALNQDVVTLNTVQMQIKDDECGDT